MAPSFWGRGDRRGLSIIRAAALLPTCPLDWRPAAAPGRLLAQATVRSVHLAADPVERDEPRRDPPGVERRRLFFEETLERALDPTQPPPDNVDEVAARYAAAAPRY